MSLWRGVVKFPNYVWRIYTRDNKAGSALLAKKKHLNMLGFKVTIIYISMFTIRIWCHNPGNTMVHWVELLPYSSRVPGSFLSPGYHMCEASVHVLSVFLGVSTDFLWLSTKMQIRYAKLAIGVNVYVHGAQLLKLNRWINLFPFC